MKQKERAIRKRHHNKWSIDLPAEYTCGDCKEFDNCRKDPTHAIPGDQTCIWIPSKFALPNQKSQADLMIEKEEAICKTWAEKEK